MTTRPQEEAVPNADAVTRTARVGDKLITTDLVESGLSGFALAERPEVPVSLIPGTELRFDKDIHYYHRFSGLRFCVSHKTARFRQFLDGTSASGGSLELADGRIVMLTELAAGQSATIVQVPPSEPSSQGGSVGTKSDEA